MKRLWINVPKWDKKIVTTALESNADAVLVPKGFTNKVKDLGLIKTISQDGDLKLGKDVVIVTIDSKEDEKKALQEYVSSSKIVSSP